MSKLTPEIIAQYPLLLVGYKPSFPYTQYSVLLDRAVHDFLSNTKEGIIIRDQAVEALFKVDISSEEVQYKEIVSKFTQIIEFFCFALNTADTSLELAGARERVSVLKTTYQEINDLLPVDSLVRAVTDVFLAYLESFYRLFVQAGFQKELKQYRKSSDKTKNEAYVFRIAKLVLSLYSKKLHLPGENRYEFLQRLNKNKKTFVAVLQNTRLLENGKHHENSEVRTQSEAIAAITLKKINLLSEYTDDQSKLIFILADYFLDQLDSIDLNVSLKGSEGERKGRGFQVYQGAPYLFTRVKPEEDLGSESPEYLEEETAGEVQDEPEARLISMFELDIRDLFDLNLAVHHDYLITTDRKAVDATEKERRLHQITYQEKQIDTLIALLEIELSCVVSIIFKEFTFANLRNLVDCLRLIAELSNHTQRDLQYLLRFYPIAKYIYENTHQLVLKTESKKNDPRLAAREHEAFKRLKYLLDQVKAEIEQK